ncbi:hypothetical protein CsSME_00044270 [Camellia sinensis var. sinensis]
MMFSLIHSQMHYERSITQKLSKKKKNKALFVIT